MYGKIFTSMYDGTLRTKWQALVAFQQMIVLADQDGVVDMTVEAIAARTGIPLGVIAEGVEFLEQPDKFSRSPESDGKRVERLNPHRPWGWRIVNYARYRDMRSAEDRREYHRQYYHDKNRNAARKLKASAQQHDVEQSTQSGSRNNGPVQVSSRDPHCDETTNRSIPAEKLNSAQHAAQQCSTGSTNAEVEALRTPLPPEGEPRVEGLDPEAWTRFTDYRSQIRKPLKTASILAAKRKLANFGAAQQAVVEQTVANGWQGLFDLKQAGKLKEKSEWM